MLTYINYLGANLYNENSNVRPLINNTIMKKTKGTLFLIPVHLGGEIDGSVPKSVTDIALRLDEFIVENVRSARRFLIAAGYSKSIDDIVFHTLNKHTDKNELYSFISSLKKGKDVGLLSEAGCPCIADPGQIIVNIAQKEGINIKPLVGPNSMLLGLMASGMNGQCFSFKGYLPIEKHKREKSIKDMEQDALNTGCTQIFMETPFRNNKMIEDILQVCKPNTMLCIAVDITLDTEFIATRSISEWKKHRQDINKRPAVFLLNRA